MDGVVAESKRIVARWAIALRLCALVLGLSAAPATAETGVGPVSSASITIRGKAYSMKSGDAWYLNRQANGAPKAGSPISISILFADNSSLILGLPDRSGTFDGSKPLPQGGMTANFYDKTGGYTEYGISTGSCGSPGFILDLNKNGTSYTARFAGKLLKGPCSDRSKMVTIDVKGDIAFKIN